MLTRPLPRTPLGRSRSYDQRIGGVIGFVLQNTLRAQIVILAASAALLPLYYGTLELSKRIVNCALGDQPSHFPHPIGVPGFILFEVDRVPLLVIFCVTLLAIYFAYDGLKYFVNVYKAVLGERMLLVLRRELYEAVSERLMKDESGLGKADGYRGSLISIITTEVEPLSGFFSEAVATPVMEGGLLLTAFTFVFLQNALLGAVLVLVYPFQLFVLPRLQVRQTRLEAMRVRQARRVSDFVNETAGHRSSATRPGHSVTARFDHLTRRIFGTRRRYYRVKFGINFFMNFLGQFTPLLMYLIGGILVLQGRLSVGALVAVVAAQKDLTPPWKELMDFWQTYLSAETKFAQIFEGIGVLGGREMVGPPGTP